MFVRLLLLSALLLGACGPLGPHPFDDGLRPVVEPDCLGAPPGEEWRAVPVSVSDWAKGAGDFVSARYPGLMASGRTGVLRLLGPPASALIGLADGGVLAAVDREIRRLDVDQQCSQVPGEVLGLFADAEGTVAVTWDERGGAFGEAYLLSSGTPCSDWQELWRASSRQFESPARLSGTVLFVEVDVRRVSQLMVVRVGSSPMPLPGIQQPRAVRVFNGFFWVFGETEIVVLTEDLMEARRYTLSSSFRDADVGQDRLLIATVGGILEARGVGPPVVVTSQRSIQGVGANLGGWYTGDGLLRRIDDDSPLRAVGTPLSWVSLAGGQPVVRSPFAMPQSWDATAQRWVDAIPREPIVEVGGLFEFAPVSRSDFVGVGSRQIWLFDQHGRRTFLDELAVPTVITNEDIPVVVQGMSSRCRTSTPVVVANRVDARLIWRDTEWRITKLPTVRPVCVAVRGSSFAVCHSNGMTSVSDDWGETWQERPGVPSLGRSGQIALLPYPRPDPSRVRPETWVTVGPATSVTLSAQT